jgi:hypothetical protein
VGEVLARRSFRLVSGDGEVVGAFGWSELRQGVADGIPEVVEGLGGDLAEQRLQLSERVLYQNEIGRIGLQVTQCSACGSIVTRTPVRLWDGGLSMMTMGPVILR